MSSSSKYTKREPACRCILSSNRVSLTPALSSPNGSNYGGIHWPPQKAEVREPCSCIVVRTHDASLSSFGNRAEFLLVSVACRVSPSIWLVLSVELHLGALSHVIAAASTTLVCSSLQSKICDSLERPRPECVNGQRYVVHAASLVACSMRQLFCSCSRSAVLQKKFTCSLWFYLWAVHFRHIRPCALNVVILLHG